MRRGLPRDHADPSCRLRRLACLRARLPRVRPPRRAPPVHVCERCFAPLEVAYDEERLRLVTRESIAAGPHTIWRYAGLLPAGQDEATRVDLGAGMTPLREARNLAKALGMRKLRVKDDSANPTHSFKDRVVSVALSAARGFGFTTVSCASTGNLANSVAAHATRPVCARSCSSRTTSSRARSCRRRCTGRRSSPSRATTTTSTGSAARSPRTRLGVRQRQRPALLRRGQQDARLRGRRAARLAAARAGRSSRWRPARC